jgi:hypothetical protein
MKILGKNVDCITKSAIGFEQKYNPETRIKI